MSPSTISRRAFLRGGAAMAIALPLLESLRPRGFSGRAQASTPRRFVAYAQPLSIFASLFFPTEPGRPTFDPHLTALPKVHLSGEGYLDNAGFTLPPLLRSLAAHKSDIIVLEGLDNSTHNHAAYSSSLTGTAGVDNQGELISLDQILAERLGRGTKFPSLQVSVAAGGTNDKDAISWYGPGRAAPAIQRPSELFRRLFSDHLSDPQSAELLRMQGRSVLDAAMEQARAMQPRLGVEDRAKLDNYLTGFRAVEERLAVAPTSCTAPAAPPGGDETIEHHGGHEKIPTFAELQLDMLAMALACDLTRVATFQLATEANNFTFPWLQITTRWHDMSHYKGEEWPPADGYKSVDDYIAVSQWSIDLFGAFVRRLAELGVLDDTVLLYFVPMHHGGYHGSSNIPLVIAGGGGGRLRTGRHLRYDRRPSPRKMNDLLVTLAQAMGVELPRIGPESMNRGLLTEMLR